MTIDDSFGWPNSLAVGHTLDDWSQEDLEQPITQPSEREQRYEKIALIGQGGMGQVWLGWDHALKRNVAIKVPLGPTQNSISSQLQREVLLIAKLDHPGIVTIHDVYQEEDKLSFVMALIHGDTLTTVLKNTTNVDEDYVLLSLLYKTCETIAYAHHRGIIHRDLSPNNIIITKDNSVKVIDWGLALSIDEAQHNSYPAGTPQFMSPEQQQGKALTVSSDVWSLGAILKAILKQTQHNSPSLNAIADRATQQQPQDRYADATTLARELDRWFKGQRIATYDTTLWRQFKQITRYYKKPLLISFIFITLILSTVSWGLWSIKQESIQTKHAERVAKQHLAALHHRAAVSALNHHHYLQAYRESITSFKTYKTPESLGLISLLKLTPRAIKTQQQHLSSCQGTRYITSIKKHWICRNNNTITAIRGDQKIWTKTIDELFDVRVFQDKLFILHHGLKLLVLNLHTGRTYRQDNRSARFANSNDGTRYNEKTQTIYYENGLEQRIKTKDTIVRTFPLKTTTFVHGTINNYTLKNNHLTPIPLAIDGYIEYAFEVDQNIWMLTKAGELLTVENNRTKIYHFQDYIKHAIHLPNSPYIVLLGIKGTAQVFDTAQKKWLLELPFGAHKIFSASDKTIGMVWNSGILQYWRVPKQLPIWRFKGVGHGFSNTAWNRTSTTVAAVDGGGLFYAFEPKNGTVYQQQVLGKRVAKWVDSYQDDNAFYAVGMDTNGIQRIDLQANTQTTKHHISKHAIGERRLTMLTNQWMCLSNEGYSAHCIQQHTGHKISLATTHNELNYKHNPLRHVIDLAPHPARSYAILTSKWYLALWAPPLKPTIILNNTQHLFASALDHKGRIATISPTHLFVYSESGTPIHSWKLSHRPVDVAWRPGKPHIATAHMDGSIKIWHMNGTLLLKATPHNKRVGTFSISSNGQMLSSAGWDGYVYTLDLSVIEDPLQH